MKYEALVEDEVYVSRASAEDPKVPSYEGGKFPLSTYLADRVRRIVSDRDEWRPLPDQVREWLEIQEWRSLVPGPTQLLIETFPRGNRYYFLCYPFEGRLAHQTLGMLLTRRLERARLRPLGFVANEYALAVWGLGDVAKEIERGGLSLAALFDEDMLGDDLEAWLAKSALMKRTFRTCAIIGGLIERRFRQGEIAPGSRRLDRSRLRRAAPPPARPHPPPCCAGRCRGGSARHPAPRRYARADKDHQHQALDHVPPLAVPVMLEIGRETVYGEASEQLLAAAEAELVKEAMQ